MKIDPHHFNAESDFIKSLLNRDSSIISSSLKIDSLFDELAGELTLLKSIPPGIIETDCDPEEEIRLIKRLLYDNSSPQIDLPFTPDDPMPSGIKEDDYDLKGIFSSLKNFFVMIHFHFLKMSHFILIFFPAKPPDDNSGILNVKAMGDISEHKVPMPRLMITQPTLVPNQKKSPDLLPHMGHEASQPSIKCLMMIYGRSTPILDVSFLHFYSP
nr:hypothetical protein [Tanacetum cinerariifolium]